MKFFAHCDRCHKRRLFIAQRNMRPPAATTISAPLYIREYICGPCYRGLRKVIESLPVL